MGQYYMPTLIDSDGTIRTLYSHDYDNGLKLMEHSYIGNNFVGAVLSLIWKHPMKVAWIGDYADDFLGDAYESKLPHDEFMVYYTAAHRDEEKKYRIRPASTKLLEMHHKRRYLVNHTSREYIDLGSYIAANKWTEKGSYHHGIYDPYDSYDMCINPLPLLTACGNGRGGGDYHEQFPNYDSVGEWAFDLIELTDKRPKDYSAYDIIFTEQQAAA